MTEQHECEWTPLDTNFGELDEAEWFICEHCPAILSREDVIARLNEYNTLKAATEKLSALSAAFIYARLAHLLTAEDVFCPACDAGAGHCNGPHKGNDEIPF